MAHMENKVKTIKSQSSIIRTEIIDILKKIIRNEYYEKDAIFTLFTLKISSRQCCLNKFLYYRTVFNYQIHKIQLLKIKVFDHRIKICFEICHDYNKVDYDFLIYFIFSQ